MNNMNNLNKLYLILDFKEVISEKFTSYLKYLIKDYFVILLVFLI